MIIETLKSAAIHSEFDYVFLMSHLSRFSNPRKQVTKLLKTNQIIRVKKGIYVFGPHVGASPYSHEILANLIYGPSYISLEYALSFYGLIPEKVLTVTSVTCKRNKQFDTPIGTFTYQYVHPKKYTVGFTRALIARGRYALMATPEKALIDKIDQDQKINTMRFLKEYLYDNLRIKIEDIQSLSRTRIKAISKHYSSSGVQLFKSYLEIINE